MNKRKSGFLEVVVGLVAGLALFAGVPATASGWGWGGRNQSCVIPAAGLVAWWSAEGNAGDSWGSNNGTLENGASFASGMVGQAFSFDGNQQWVSVPDAQLLNFGTGPFTISLWVYFNDTSDEHVMVEKWIQRGEGQQSEGWTLTSSDGGVRLAVSAPYSAQEYNVDSPENLVAPYTWYHFAARRSGSELTLFFNGMPIASAEVPIELHVNSTSSLKLGHRGNQDDTPGSVEDRQVYLNGLLDEVQVFNTALSDAEIQAIYDASSAGTCHTAGTGTVNGITLWLDRVPSQAHVHGIAPRSPSCREETSR
ncbi:MAG: hypothetical protein AMS22_15830 [Thiotrichales bacterium SG8_50]|nr:MAG: hypothetical protein AMS22_15830 [Thiotrichales bacterium SG8_50]